MQRFEGEGFILRPWRNDERDRATLVRHADDRMIWRNLRDLFPHPYRDADARTWLAYAAADPPPPYTFAIEIDGDAVGTIAVNRADDIERCSAEIGYWLGREYWGRGIMTAAVRAVTEAAMREPDLYRLYAYVFAWNPGSMRVLEKAGYERECVLTRSGVKDGVVIDRVLYAVTRNPGLPYASVVGSS